MAAQLEGQATPPSQRRMPRPQRLADRLASSSVCHAEVAAGPSFSSSPSPRLLLLLLLPLPPTKMAMKTHTTSIIFFSSSSPVLAPRPPQGSAPAETRGWTRMAPVRQESILLAACP